MKRANIIVFGGGLLLLELNVFSIGLAVEGFRGQPGTLDNTVTQEDIRAFEQAERIVEITDSVEVSQIIARNVDLNDYLAEPGDDTNYNYTEIGEEEERILKENGVYYDKNLECWCRKN